MKIHKNDDLFKLLKSVDTPTVCNAIELAEGKRGFNGFSKSMFQVADVSLPPMVGYAKTARIKASEPSQEPAELVKEKRMNYYKYMSECDTPSICVIEDVDYPHCVGAFWGEVNNHIHKGFGLGGTLTNGLMRDMDFLAPNYQVLASSVGVSHAFVHVLDFDEPVQIFGIDIEPYDFIHADRHGAVVIPKHLLPVLGKSITKLIDMEKIVLEPAKQEDFDFEKFKTSWEAFEKARV